YILMKKRTMSAYIKAFNFLSKNIKKNPKYILIDFEMAAYQAISKTFPDSKVGGCFFHFSQNIWRKIQKLQLTSIYKNENNFRKLVKMMCALSFVPIKNLKDEIEKFQNYAEKSTFYSQFKLIFLWFKNTYCFDIQNENSKRTIFSPSFWSVSTRIIESCPITTNAIEGWHRSLNSNIRTFHPSIFTLGKELLCEQRKAEFKITKEIYEKFNSLGKNEIKYEEELLKSIIEKYEDFHGIEFLLTISSLIELKIS
ncbi:hypothetical protein DMUE_4159, partial [Dictyocoela muelleri]